MRRHWTRQDLQGASLWWVVSLTVAGRAYRWAESPLAIASDDGGLAIGGGLSGAQVTQTAPWLGLQPEQRQATVDLSPSVDLNPSAALAAQYILDGAPVEIALWKQGDTWEERQILLSGFVTGYQWGGPNEVLTIEGTEAATQDRGLIPDPGAVVSVSTWPDAAEPAIGLFYPTILGAPGSDGTIGAVALVVEATQFDALTLLVAGHPVSAEYVTVSDGSTSEVLAVSTAPDGLGRLVAVVDLTAATTIASDPAITYQVAWDQGGAGLLAITGTDAALGAGSVLEAVLALSTLPIDRGSLASARDALNAYQIGAFVQQQLSPLDWITKAILPLLPVAVLTGPDGWRVVPIPLVPTQADCVGALYAGPAYTQVVRMDRAQRAGFDDVANEIEVKYALDLTNNATAKSARMSGQGFVGGDHTSLSSQVSLQTYGRRVKTIETVAIYDTSTAYRLLRWQAIAYGFTRSVVRYSCALEYAFLSPGSLVWLVDTLLKFDRAAWVQQVILTPDGRVELELVCWEVPNA